MTRHCRRRVAGPVIVVLAAAFGAAHAGADGTGVSVSPLPGWLADPGWNEAASAASAEPAGTRYRLFDEQVRVAPGETESYWRTVWTAESTAAVQDASEIEISFDPTYERLVVHHARIVRRGRTVWSFSPKDVRVNDAEENAEARLYNGERTATIFLRDLRVGDTVDYAYSHVGANPVLGGRFDSVLWVGASVPVDVLHRRLLWQKAAAPQMRRQAGAGDPEIRSEGGGTSYRWLVRDWKPAGKEERTPSWYVPWPRVEVSEFADWAAVAGRTRELFRPLEEPAPSIDSLVRGLGLDGADEDARLDRAVRFVQDEVRYLGLEMGPSSHRPHAPAETLARRFGDCKDKSALLVAMLRRVGIPAWPALVSTRNGRTLDARLPSLFAFDHVIVAFRLADGLHFVDATASEQGGPVRGRRAPPFHRALLVDASTLGFTPIPRPPEATPSTDVEETFVVPSWGAPSRLEVVTTYRGEDADDARRSHARANGPETTKRYRDFYAREHAQKIRALGSPRFEDDRARNVVVVRETYEAPGMWEDGVHDFRAWLVDEWLKHPAADERRAPLALGYPAFVRHTLRLRLPGPPDLEPMRETVSDASFSMDATWTVHETEARLVYTYRTLRDSVPAGEVARYSRTVDQAADLVVCRMPARVRPAATASATARRAAPPAPAPAPASRRRATQDADTGGAALAGLGAGTAGVALWGTGVGVAAWRRGRTRRRVGALPPRAARPVSAAVVALPRVVSRVPPPAFGAPIRQTMR